MNEGVSVIVPAKGRCPRLGVCLSSLAALRHQPLEIILVDDGLRESARTVAASFADRVIRINNPGQGVCAARNAGVARARYRFVAFTDADCVVRPDWIENLMFAFDDRTVSVGGGQTLPQDAGAFRRSLEQVYALSSLLVSNKRRASKVEDVRHNASCNVVYRKDALCAVGGFAEGTWPYEDLDLDRRLSAVGMRMRCVPNATVGHYGAETYCQFVRMIARYGYGRGRSLRDGARFEPVHAALLAYVGFEIALIIGLFVAWKVTFAAIVFFLVFLFGAVRFRSLEAVVMLTAIKVWKIFFLKGLLTPNLGLMKEWHNVSNTE
jgi:glycosyltransferase involved in cell wall biosynthesis